jgi:hypothetical protein
MGVIGIERTTSLTSIGFRSGSMVRWHLRAGFSGQVLDSR